MKRDYLYAHYLSMEVENSCGRKVKENHRRVLSGKRLRKAACSDVSPVLSNRLGTHEQLGKKVKKAKGGSERSRPCSYAPVGIPCCVGRCAASP